MINIFRQPTKGFVCRFVVTSVETVPFERHPPGALAKWENAGKNGPPAREMVSLTVARLEPVRDHGETTTVANDATDLHALGYFDVRSIHPKAAATLKVGQVFDLNLESA